MFENKVSVIICCYTLERFNDIHEAVDSVMSQTLEPHELIIAVDHNVELLEKLKEVLPLNIKIILNEGVKGLSETRNVGIRNATGDIVAFIDDDAVAEKDWLIHLATPFQDKRVVAVGGMAIPLWHDGGRPAWFPEELDWIVGCTYKGLPLNGSQIRNVPGCNMAFLKDAFNVTGLWESKIGSIGQSLKGGEEAELCLRITEQLSNSIIIWQPNSVINHKVPSTRTTLKWIIKDSFDQGLCKIKLKKLKKRRVKKSLSTESSYLSYLLFTSIPQRLRWFYKKGNLRQTVVILMCIVFTGIGYFMGKTRKV